ncbi:hypothetical protein H0A36_28090 [Endozoicomonas sp. SM1973]|uniref:Uncharacterized protein n=1 Tax=Spartinivicinus marinus TaxID=2994442 RepID=A0A853IH87_9GAMM|nr:hypothetical protein [Spartinivicinus marinus]MCX4025616.1 hypothetical protein [Spartinivicinus marinus]NYZ69878.1 hypothetical protein [Spartinivicinus marinus]
MDLSLNKSTTDIHAGPTCILCNQRAYSLHLVTAESSEGASFICGLLCPSCHGQVLNNKEQGEQLND